MGKSFVILNSNPKRKVLTALPAGYELRGPITNYTNSGHPKSEYVLWYKSSAVRNGNSPVYVKNIDEALKYLNNTLSTTEVNRNPARKKALKEIRKKSPKSYNIEAMEAYDRVYRFIYYNEKSNNWTPSRDQATRYSKSIGETKARSLMPSLLGGSNIEIVRVVPA